MKHRDLPLSALRAFVIAAQWKSLTKAATELGVTHGAISKQIQQLEKWIGTDLFVRQGRGLTLTSTGHTLAQQVGQSFVEMLNACSDMTNSGKKQVITIEAPATFAMYWLLPQIQFFEQEFWNTDVTLLSRLSNQDYDGPPADIVITRGNTYDNRLKGFEEQPIFTETMGLVASPSFVTACKIENPEDVFRHPMVGSVTRPNDWPQWLKKANLYGEDLQYRHMFDHFFIALHCVMSGIGTIVSPINAFKYSLHSVRFATLLPDIQFPGETYYVRYRPRRSAKVSRLCDMILASGTVDRDSRIIRGTS